MMKIKWITELCNNIGELWKYYMDLKKPDTKKHIPYNIIYIKFKKGKTNLWW